MCSLLQVPHTTHSSHFEQGRCGIYLTLVAMCPRGSSGQTGTVRFRRQLPSRLRGDLGDTSPAGEARGHLPVAPDEPPGPRPRRLASPTLTRRRPRTTDQARGQSNRCPASHAPGRWTDPATGAEVGLGLARVGHRGGGLAKSYGTNKDTRSPLLLAYLQ